MRPSACTWDVLKTVLATAPAAEAVTATWACAALKMALNFPSALPPTCQPQEPGGRVRALCSPRGQTDPRLSPSFLSTHTLLVHFWLLSPFPSVLRQRPPLPGT